jgi:hypothetical protein
MAAGETTMTESHEPVVVRGSRNSRPKLKPDLDLHVFVTFGILNLENKWYIVFGGLVIKIYICYITF